MTTQILTQSRLKEILHYCPDSGHFTWIKQISNRIKVGRVANSKDYLGYIRIRIDSKIYQAHRLVFLYVNGDMPRDEVDHINHDRADNRLENVRIVSRAENCRNISKNKSNKSGVTGVYFCKSRLMWVADIGINGKTQHLGRFKTKSAATLARKSAEVEIGYHENHGVGK